MSMKNYKEKIGSLNNTWDKVDNLAELVESAESKEKLKDVGRQLVALSRQLVEKWDEHLEKLNDIDGYIYENIDKAIDYETLVWYLKRDNMYSKELEDWLNTYMKFYNKKEVINVWN